MKTNFYSKPVQWLIFAAILLLLLTSDVWSNTISKATSSALLLLLIIVLVAGKVQMLPRSVISPVVISVIVYLAIYTISLFYATTGLFALSVFSYYVQGIVIFFLTIILVNKDQQNTRSLFYTLSLAIAIGGIISIDSASIRLLSRGLESILRTLLGAESFTLGGFEAGVRMTSIMGNPNTFASLCAFGILSAAYLFLTSSSARDQKISCGLLIINAVSFLYCFSLGSLIGMFFAVAILVLLVGKELRFSMIYLILTTMFFGFLSVFLGFSGMGNVGVIALLPFISLVLFGVFFFFALRYMSKVEEKLITLGAAKIKASIIIFLLIGASGLAAAVTLGDSYTFTEASGVLRRSVTLSPEIYLLHLDGPQDNADIQISVESQNYQQASTHTSSRLYHGALDPDIRFTVPEDAKMCFIEITAPDGTKIDAIKIFTTDGLLVSSLKPDYLLLPSFMANRLQGILVNQNAMQRLVFFEDGIKIARLSPVIGHGPGAFESKVLAVQDYYYETKSPHNHYIQTLDEVGIFGLASFLSIFICCIFALFRKPYKNADKVLTSVLFAMLVMILTHAALEVTFSFGVYNMAAFMVYGLISANLGQNKSLPLSSSSSESVFTSKGKVKKQPQQATVAALPRYLLNTSIVISIFIFFIYLGQFTALQLVNSVNQQKDALKFLDTLEKGMILDFTNKASYKTTYLVSFLPDFPEPYYLKSQKYADEMKNYGSFDAMTYVVNYYLNLGENENAYHALNNRQSLKRYDQTAWNETFDLYRGHMAIAQDSPELNEWIPVIEKYAGNAYQQLQAYLEISPLEIILSEENIQFIEVNLLFKPA